MALWHVCLSFPRLFLLEWISELRPRSHAGKPMSGESSGLVGFFDIDRY